MDVKVTTVHALHKLPANDLKAVGFKPEVRNKLLRVLKGHEPEAGTNATQEQFVTFEEEEEASFENSSETKKSRRKKKSAKPVSAVSAKLGAEQSPLIDMKIDSIVTVKIVEHYPEKDVFLVADNTVYGLRVQFSDTEAKDSFKVGEVITAIFVEARFKSSSENEVEFLVLKNAHVVNSSLCALSRPVVLLVRRETQVRAR